jgi:FlaA1/EpsC-like NDP-sugar epimerase
VTTLTFEKIKISLLNFLTQHGQRLKQKCLRTSFWIILLTDAICIILALILATYLRFESLHFAKSRFYYFGVLSALLAIKLPVFYIMGLYTGMWRYTGMRDMQNIVKAVLLSSLLIVSIMFYVNQFQGYSRAVFVIDALLCLLFISASRISIRYLLLHRKIRYHKRIIQKKRLLLVGAGDTAEKVVREINSNPALPYELAGFVDDNPYKIGRRIHGIPVLGSIDDLPNCAEQTHAEELLIAVVAVTGKQMKRIVNLCQQTGLPFKILPGLDELIDGKVSVKASRDISYRDLLGREEARLDQEKIGAYVTGKVVLVTGAGGSIGSELCRQLLRFQPSQIILFDAGEENLYAIQMELEHVHAFKRYIPVLGKVQTQELLNNVFSQYNPEVVFHAAAYKHVPLVEINPWEAVYNNILAAKYLMETSLRYGVKRFVLVSTDKAVRPTNVMGASKRITELLMLSFEKRSYNQNPPTADRQRTIFQAVRFGNVLGSSGSVIPLFKRQIEMGGPLTVTHPEITRYFMSIEEAAQLIIQAGAMGTGNEIFILKMGEPIKIDKMARDLIRLAGKEPETDIEIVYTGLRPGEKLYEELITEGEGIVETNHEKIMVLKGDDISAETLQDAIQLLEKNAQQFDKIAIKETIKNLLPEYTSWVSQ